MTDDKHPANKRPTIAELESILSQPAGGPVEILPSGEIRVANKEPDPPPIAATLQVGDLVQLKSGGPTMTIDSLAAGSRWRCVWFNTALGLGISQHEFPAACLRIVATRD